MKAGRGLSNATENLLHISCNETSIKYKYLIAIDITSCAGVRRFTTADSGQWQNIREQCDGVCHQ